MFRLTPSAHTLRFMGNCKYVRCEREADLLCRQLSKVSVLGVDSEWNTSYRKGVPAKDTALLQIAWEAEATKSSSSTSGKKKTTKTTQKKPTTEDHATTETKAVPKTAKATSKKKQAPPQPAIWDMEKTETYPALQRQMNVALFHLKHMETFPSKLREVLENPNTLKVGAHIRGDLARLIREGRIHPDCENYDCVNEHVKDTWVEIDRMAKRKMLMPKADLSSLSEALFGEPIGKGDVRTGNWEVELLSAEQQEYAATDAAMHLAAYWELNEKADLPEHERLEFYSRNAKVKANGNGADGTSSSGSSTSRSKDITAGSKGSAWLANGDSASRSPRVSLEKAWENHRANDFTGWDGEGNELTINRAGEDRITISASSVPKTTSTRYVFVPERLAQDAYTKRKNMLRGVRYIKKEANMNEAEKGKKAAETTIQSTAEHESDATVVSKKSNSKKKKSSGKKTDDAEEDADNLQEKSGAVDEIGSNLATIPPSSIELSPSVARCWFRVMQQGYTIAEASEELDIKSTTVESYIWKALFSGRSYVWGPHLGISDDGFIRIIRQLTSRDLDEISNAAGVGVFQTRLAVWHLKQLVENLSPTEIVQLHGLPRTVKIDKWQVKRITLPPPNRKGPISVMTPFPQQFQSATEPTSPAAESTSPVVAKSSASLSDNASVSTPPTKSIRMGATTKSTSAISSARSSSTPISVSKGTSKSTPESASRSNTPLSSSKSETLVPSSLSDRKGGTQSATKSGSKAATKVPTGRLEASRAQSLEASRTQSDEAIRTRKKTKPKVVYG